MALSSSVLGEVVEVAVTFSTLYGELVEPVVVELVELELVAMALGEVEVAIDAREVAFMKAVFKVEGERMYGEEVVVGVVVGMSGERATVEPDSTCTPAPPFSIVTDKP